jgi:hypothetical protein
MIIDDGRGRGYQAGVNETGHVFTRANSEQVHSHNAMHDATTFRIVSAYSATADDIILYFKSDDVSNYFRLESIILSSAVAQLWTIYKVASGTAGGTALTPVNTNFASGKTAEATLYGNAAVTGSLTNGGTFFSGYTPANTAITIEFAGSVLLSVNTAFAIDCNATGAVSCTIEGWYELPGAGH